jgi:arylsulfatase A-like enzyme
MACAGIASIGGSAQAPGRPNLLLILVDDQAMNSFKREFMPRTFHWLVDHGTLFRNGLAAPPLCCPDRAGILTGEYPHSSGVLSNDPGYPALRRKGETLPAWLLAAGYRTGFVGKFLNAYSTFAGNFPAPGFQRWFALTDRVGYYDYHASSNGRIVHFGSKRSSYSTDVFTRRAREFIQTSSRRPRPFFLWLSYNAPHPEHHQSDYCGHNDPQPATEAAYLHEADTPLPHPPSFNEADVSDKPATVEPLVPITAAKEAELAERYRCTVASMREVDLGVDRVMRTLRDTGELANTVVVYASDNGFYFGEHRITLGKSLPYEPALQVPFAVRVPEAYRSRHQPLRSPEAVANIDIAPTFLELAHATSCVRPGRCRRIDGHSLLPLLGAGGHWPGTRGVLVEIAAASATYQAIRTRRKMYAEYPNGDRELYDLGDDPFELSNQAGNPAYAADEARLAARLEKLRDCSGTSGALGCE